MGNWVKRDFADVLPAPASAIQVDGVEFVLGEDVVVVTEPESTEAARIGAYLAGLLGNGATTRPGDSAPAGGIALLLSDGVDADGDEAYQLDIDSATITLRARDAAGLFRGVQTLRQLIPDGPGSREPSARPGIPGGRIVDRPRYRHRGVMLDVARHFFDVAAVKRLIDLAAIYKLNHLHLHLTDDQGWRIAVDRWPRLTGYGGGTEVGTGSGGFYTKDDYREIVAYAGAHFITVVPEVDVPGHTNAALASYPELNCDGHAPPRYTGIEVGFSSLCPHREITYQFLDQVFGELAALTPGPYLHIGGDEAESLSPDDYALIVGWAQEAVAAHGKTAVGWHEVAAAKLSGSTVLQFWGVRPEAPQVLAAAAAGNKVIMSPADRTYLDMKYDDATPIGLTWAGTVSVRDAYDWDPATHLAGLDDQAVLGVESPLWTETVATIEDIEYLAFPRLAATAEIGWSPAGTHDWTAFRARLAAQVPLWHSHRLSYHRAAGIDWPEAAGSDPLPRR